MRMKNVPKKLINTISWFYLQTKFKVGGDTIDINRGVIQGGVLSPTLFLIMFDGLIEELKEQNLEVLAYADDLAIVGFGLEELNRAIVTIERWIDRNRMKLNKGKSGILFHEKKGRKLKAEKRIRDIPVVDEYKYLGIWIDKNLTMNKHLGYINGKVERAMKMIKIMRWRGMEEWRI